MFIKQCKALNRDAEEGKYLCRYIFKSLLGEKGMNNYRIKIFFRFALSLLMSLSLLFSFCLGVNELKISFYETIHRKSVQNIAEFRFFSGEIDSIINAVFIVFFICMFFFRLVGKGRMLRLWILTPLTLAMASCLFFLAGFRMLSFVLLVPAYFIHLFLKREFKQFLNFYMWFLIAVEALSLLRWVTCPLLHSEIYSDASWFFSRFNSLLFYVFNSVLGNTMILSFVFSFPVFILSFIKHIRVEGSKIHVELSKSERQINSNQVDLELSRGRILLLYSFLILLYLSYLPYFPSLNPLNKPVSVDIVFYVDYLNTFKQLGLSSEGVNYLLGIQGARATAIFLTYLVSLVSSLSSTEAVKASIFIASYLLVLATYFSLKSVVGNNSIMKLSIFFSVFSIQVIVGLYAGYLANLVAIPFLLLMVLFFSRAMKGETRFFLLAIFFSAIALYSHPWSWTIFVLAVFLLLPLNLVLSLIGVRDRYDKNEVKTIFFFTLVNLLLDFSKQLLFKSVGGIYAEYAVTRGSFSISNIFLLNRNLDELTQIYVGGYTSNILIYALSIAGVFSLLVFNNVFFDSLFLILTIAAAPFLFVNETLQSRLLYVLPTNIYAATGLHKVSVSLKKKGVEHQAFIILVLLSLANYSFRSIVNLV